jgi:hypothetical protein
MSFMEEQFSKIFFASTKGALALTLGLAQGYK